MSSTWSSSVTADKRRFRQKVPRLERAIDAGVKKNGQGVETRYRADVYLGTSEMNGDIVHLNLKRLE